MVFDVEMKWNWYSFEPVYHKTITQFLVLGFQGPELLHVCASV